MTITSFAGFDGQASLTNHWATYIIIIWVGILEIRAEYIVFEQLTLASAAGFTFPFTPKAPPRTTICPIFFKNEGSCWIAYTNG